MVNQRWLSQKLKKLSQKRKWSKNMENKEQQDVTINVTQENKEKLEGEEDGNSRKDD